MLIGYLRSFTVESSEIDKRKGIRGKGAKGKSNLAIMAESTPLKDIEKVKHQAIVDTLRQKF